MNPARVRLLRRLFIAWIILALAPFSGHAAERHLLYVAAPGIRFIDTVRGVRRSGLPERVGLARSWSD